MKYYLKGFDPNIDWASLGRAFQLSSRLPVLTRGPKEKEVYVRDSPSAKADTGVFLGLARWENPINVESVSWSLLRP
ncbi:SS18-like protein 2 isoform X3 [Dama dama]|uniref:SS18-like protein 2 isoform X3 n=1 Tax=Dama dama TaxID=30532 RepID=UPI002A36B3CE|nr:SS18-like protein 2 isoform X3 [Dama dama]